MLFQLLFFLAILATFISGLSAADAVVNQKKNGPEPILNITLDGAIVGARLRCQGFLCPQWALDIGRYDYVQQLGTEFQYILQELLPLAPTAERSGRIYTAYDSASRELTVVAANYPESGIDSFWVSTINADITSAAPVYSNVMIPHPDAAPNSPGSLKLTKLETFGGKTVAIFADGSVHQLDIKNQRYLSMGSLFLSTEDAAKYALTEAHVLDGFVLKTFAKDARDNTYLIKSDVSGSQIKPSAPLKVTPIKGQVGTETPIAAHMVAVGDAAPKLLILNHGNFDSIGFIDEDTGVTTSSVANLADNYYPQPALLYCDTNIKECDFWQTSAYDPVSKKLYFQAHYIDTLMNTYDNAIYKLEFLQNTITPGYEAYPSIAIDMQFGYAAYQFVNMA